MLSERETSMAKELARELIEINKMKKAVRTIAKAFNIIKNKILDMFNFLKEEGFNFLRNNQQKERSRKSHVPLKMNMPKPPDLNIIRIPNIRSGI